MVRDLHPFSRLRESRTSAAAVTASREFHSTPKIFCIFIIYRRCGRVNKIQAVLPYFHIFAGCPAGTGCVSFAMPFAYFESKSRLPFTPGRAAVAAVFKALCAKTSRFPFYTLPTGRAAAVSQAFLRRKSRHCRCF